jgi:hypothetical protein
MKLRRTFKIYTNGTPVLTDPISLSATVTDSVSVVVENPTSAKISLGLYGFTLDDSLYTADESYRLTGTFILISGNTQTWNFDFTWPSGGGGSTITMTLPMAVTLTTDQLDIAVEITR